MPKKLNSPFKFAGKVVDGEKVGRKIGFPTANLDYFPENLDEGVYFGKMWIGKNQYFCLAYYGPRSIFGDVKNNFEVYIYDFDANIYGEMIEGELISFIRPPLKMKKLDELKAQLQKDKMAGSKLIAK